MIDVSIYQKPVSTVLLNVFTFHMPSPDSETHLAIYKNLYKWFLVLIYNIDFDFEHLYGYMFEDLSMMYPAL